MAVPETSIRCPSAEARIGAIFTHLYMSSLATDDVVPQGDFLRRPYLQLHLCFALPKNSHDELGPCMMPLYGLRSPITVVSPRRRLNKKKIYLCQVSCFEFAMGTALKSKQK